MNPALLEQMAKLLPRLHTAMVELEQAADGNSAYSSAQDLDDRFELFSRLHRLLGEKDPYWMEFDVSADGQYMSGSLADDLTDIFCELKSGWKCLMIIRKKQTRRWMCGGVAIRCIGANISWMHSGIFMH